MPGRVLWFVCFSFVATQFFSKMDVSSHTKTYQNMPPRSKPTTAVQKKKTKKMKKKTNGTNRWMEHMLAYKEREGCSLKEAMVGASESYNNTVENVSTNETKGVKYRGLGFGGMSDNPSEDFRKLQDYQNWTFVLVKIDAEGSMLTDAKKIHGTTTIIEQSPVKSNNTFGQLFEKAMQNIGNYLFSYSDDVNRMYSLQSIKNSQRETLIFQIDQSKGVNDQRQVTPWKTDDDAQTFMKRNGMIKSKNKGLLSLFGK